MRSHRAKQRGFNSMKIKSLKIFLRYIFQKDGKTFARRVFRTMLNIYDGVILQK